MQSQELNTSNTSSLLYPFILAPEINSTNWHNVERHFTLWDAYFHGPRCCDTNTNGLKQGYFCDGTRRNAVPKVLSQKHASRNGVPEPFSPGISITNTTTPLRPNFGPLFAFRNHFRKKNSIGLKYILTRTAVFSVWKCRTITSRIM
jgi:hypothetical protein